MLAQKPFYPHVTPELSALFEAEGLTLLGVTDAVNDDAATADYQAWVASDCAGGMDYLTRHTELKYHPHRILPGCRCILVAGLNYYRRSSLQDGARTAEQSVARARMNAAVQPVSSATPHPGTEPRVARYAWGRDYHLVLGKRLRRVARRLAATHAGAEFRPFTDATPLAERYYAERAGIGFTGRNTLLISGQYGSWFVLGEILSTQYFEATSAPAGSHGACPRSCRACIDVCPTGALLGPHQIDASRCISYLTIEHRGPIPVRLRRRLGPWLFGCDLCQEVCPLNVRSKVTAEEDFLHDRAGESPELASIMQISNEEQFRARFAGSPLKRSGRQGLLRNACIVAANRERDDLLPLLTRLAHDSDTVVAEHARWAIAELGRHRSSMPGDALRGLSG